MEALQILKYNLKQERLDFVKHWVTPVTDLAPDNEDDDVEEVHGQRDAPVQVQVNTQVAIVA
jgi:hypothetical protein